MDRRHRTLVNFFVVVVKTRMKKNPLGSVGRLWLKGGQGSAASCRPEFYPESTMEKELILVSCPLTTKCRLWLACKHTHTHTHAEADTKAHHFPYGSGQTQVGSTLSLCPKSSCRMLQTDCKKHALHGQDPAPHLLCKDFPGKHPLVWMALPGEALHEFHPTLT